MPENADLNPNQETDGWKGFTSGYYLLLSFDVSITFCVLKLCLTVLNINAYFHSSTSVFSFGIYVVSTTLILGGRRAIS